MLRAHKYCVSGRMCKSFVTIYILKVRVLTFSNYRRRLAGGIRGIYIPKKLQFIQGDPFKMSHPAKFAE